MSVSSGFFTLLLTAVKSFFNWLIGKRKEAQRKEKIERIEKAETELKNACDNGNLADVIDASIKIGKARKR